MSDVVRISYQITGMRKTSVFLEDGSEILATFDVDVFPFRIRQGSIRCRSGNDLRAVLPGRKTGGISIASPALADAIRAEAMEVYREKYDDPRT